MNSMAKAAPTAGYDEPGTEDLVRKIRTTSPPRAGMTALKPYPAKYAPQMRRNSILDSGYAARRMWNEARARSVRYSVKQARARSSAGHDTAARFEAKSPTAL